MTSQEVTHVHCPPPVDAMAGLVTGQYGRSSNERQQPCWSPNGGSFCVGEAAGTGLHIVDFHPSLHSPCHVGKQLCSCRCHIKQLFHVCYKLCCTTRFVVTLAAVLGHVHILQAVTITLTA